MNLNFTDRPDRVKAIRLSLHSDYLCGKSGWMRIQLKDPLTGTKCVTHGKKDFLRGETYTWKQDDLETRNFRGYIACRDFKPSERTAVLIQPKSMNTPSSEATDQFCPLKVEIETGSGDQYKTNEMAHWHFCI